jgi:phage-related protein (TIGR01555 family)
MTKRAIITNRAGLSSGPSHPLSRGVNFGDTLINLMTGMGTEKDKLRGTVFGYNVIGKAQLDNAYRGDWISRKIVDIPAYDSFREWRTWDMDAKKADKVAGVEKTLKLQTKAMLTEMRARLYGGAAMLLGIDQGNSDDEVNYDTLRPNSLKFVHSVSRYDLAAGPLNKDVMSPYYGEPQYYTITSVSAANKASATMTFHPSRVVRFIGQESIDLDTSQGWGDPVLSIVADAVLSAGLVSGSIAQLVAEAKIDVMKIPGLAKQIMTQGYEQRLIKRVSTMNAMKSAFSVAITDKDEELDRIAASFDTLPDIGKFFMMLACGAADIPATRFLGQSPQGMNATGDSDTRNYYDRCKTVQTLRITPAMERLDKVLLISATGAYDETDVYEWDPLWQLSDAEKADIAVKKATVYKTDVDAALLNDVVLKKAREAQLVADGTYPGLQDIIDQYDDDPELENQPEPPVVDPNAPPVPANNNQPNSQDPKAGVDPTSGQPDNNQPQRGRKVATADLKRMLGDKMLQPKPLYVYREVKNPKDIIAWAKAQGFDSIIDDLHVTIVYSKAAVDWLKAGEDSYGYNANDDGGITIKAGGPRVLQLFGGASNVVVLAFASNDLAYRHSSIMYRCENASWDFDDYTPHISITYNKPATMNVDQIEPYRGVIELGPEIFEEIDPTFNNNTDVEETAL